jgi:pilus assembly protein CpaB
VVVKAITVEVTPDQAQAITLAQAVGAVSLVLRQISDQAPLARQFTTLADLSRGGAPRVAAVAPVRASVRVRAPVVRAAAPVAPRTTEVRVTRGVVTTGYEVGS